MRRLIHVMLVLLAIAALAQMVAAENYRIDITPLNNSIYPGEAATFKLSIANFEKTAQRFQVYTLSTKWVIRTEPTVSVVPALEAREYILHVRPTSAAGFGAEGILILIKHTDSRAIVRQNVIVDVKDPNLVPALYPASVQLDISLPAQIDPREPFTANLYTRNRNGLNITDMKVLITTPLFEESHQIAIEPFSEKTEERTFTLDPHLAPGEYGMNIKLIYRDKTINEISRSMSVKEVVDIAETPSDAGILFRHQTSILLENNGNTRRTHDVTLPTNLFRALFSGTEPKVKSEIVAGERVHRWSVTLDPEEMTVVSRTENYRLPLILLIIILASALSYYLFRSPLITVKETITMKQENGSGLKVRIFIKNRSGKQLTGVRVVDRVPSIATFIEQSHLGTVSPTKVVSNQKKGTMLKWDLDLLEPYEERILSYSLSSRLEIVGKIKLPSAKVLFLAGEKERVTFTQNTAFEE